jgi:hypothetical protein
VGSDKLGQPDDLVVEDLDTGSGLYAPQVGISVFQPEPISVPLGNQIWEEFLDAIDLVRIAHAPPYAASLLLSRAICLSCVLITLFNLETSFQNEYMVASASGFPVLRLIAAFNRRR